MTTNIEGLYPKSNQSKVPFLQELTELYKAKIMALSETHLKTPLETCTIVYQCCTTLRDMYHCVPVLYYP